MDVNVMHEEIVKGRITIECRLDQEFYHSPNGYEEIFLARVADVLSGIEKTSNPAMGRVELNLREVIPVGRNTSRAATWLEVEVICVDRPHEDLDEFDNFLTFTAYKIMERLIKKGDKKAVVESGNNRYVVIETD